MGHPLWPLYDLVIRTPRLEVRLPTEVELAELALIANESIFDNVPTMSFRLDWPRTASPEREQNLYKFHMKVRADWEPASWHFAVAAFLDGVPIGTQGMEATKFSQLKSVSTGSWIGADYQRQGYGTEMRAAVLELAFAGLGAEEALSDARFDNEASRGVSSRLGYVENGTRRSMFGDEVDIDVELKLTRQAWAQHRLPGVTIEGLDSCRHFFGAETD